MSSAGIEEERYPEENPCLGEMKEKKANLHLILLHRCPYHNPAQPSPGGPPAVDEEVLSGHVAARVAGEKDYRTLHFVRLPHPFHRALCAESFHHLRVGLLAGEWPWAQAVHPHAIGRPVDGQVPGHMHDSP